MRARWSCAFLAFAAAACGDNANNDDPDGNRLPDSASPLIDAGSDDAGTPGPEARVTVRFRGALAAGAFVGFHDAEGNPVDFAMTGADGTALGEVPEHGTISVGVTETDGVSVVRFVSTVHDVASTDDLLVEIARPRLDVSNGSTVQLFFQAFPGALSYQAAFCPNQFFIDPYPTGPDDYSRPLQNFSGAEIVVPAACLDDNGEANVMVVAKTEAGGNGDIIGFGGWKGLTDGEGSSFFELAADAELQFEVQNLPPTLDGVSEVEIEVITSWFVAGGSSGNGYAFALGDAGDDAVAAVEAPGGSYSGFYDFAFNAVSATVSAPGASRLSFVGVQKRGAYPGPLVFDMAEALPPIDTVTLDSTALDAFHVAWTSSAPLTDADGVRITVTSQATNDLSWTWNALSPGTLTDVTLPTFPSEMAAFAAPADGRNFSATEVQAIEHSAASGYEVVRADWFRFLTPDPRGSDVLRLSSSNSN